MSEAMTATSRGPGRMAPGGDNTFVSAIFPVETFELAGRREQALAARLVAAPDRFDGLRQKRLSHASYCSQMREVYK